MSVAAVYAWIAVYLVAFWEGVAVVASRIF